MTSRSAWRRAGALAACGFLLSHLPFLVWFLDDIDPINFALGVRNYDIARHQPHPPGYPMFILLGKIATWAFRVTGFDPAGGAVEAGALALWSIIGGALAAFPLVALFWALDETAQEITPTHERRGRVRGIAAMVMTLCCPLFWFTAARPISDVVGLSAALASQALLAGAFARQTVWTRRQRAAAAASRVGDGAGRGAGVAGGAGGTSLAAGGRAVPAEEIVASGTLIVAGALVAGLAIGLRSQTAWLTLPVLALVILDRAGRGAAGALLGSVCTFGIGVLTWFVPMLVVSGGPSAWLGALSAQADEDFTGVDMLATSAAPLRRLLFNLVETFIAPWASVPLALVVLLFASIGLIVLLWQARRGVMLLAVMVLPYAALHLLFHENETTRYALPLVVPVVYLAARGLDVTIGRAAPLAVTAIALASLAIGAPALQDYARGTSPIFHLFADMRRAPADAARPPVVAMHRRVFNESRRARDWAGAAFPWLVLPATPGHEWLDVVKYWRDTRADDQRAGGPVWFVADPRRTDLALIDASSRRLVSRYRWPVRAAADPVSRLFERALPEAFDDPAFIGGARPDEMDWYVFDRPGWFLAEGWALTPESSGVAETDGKGPGKDGVVAYVRRRPEEVRLMLGGRNLGAKGAATVRFTAALDGRVLDTWDILPDPGFFLRAFTLPAGTLAGEGDYGRLTVQARKATPPDAAAPQDSTDAGTNGHATTGHPPQPVAASVEQFDLQASSAVMFGFDTGWHESEYNPRTGRSWRWSSAAAAVRVWNGGHDVRLRLRAESPLPYFARAPIVTVRAGQRVLLTFPASGEIAIALDVPATALAEGGGALVVTTDQTFSPAERRAGVTDRRRLGLRVFEIDVAVTPAVADSVTAQR